MSQLVPNNAARRTVTFTSGTVLDADGIKMSFATVAAPVTLVVADFNGAEISATTGAFTKLPRTVTIGRSNNAAQFAVDPIVITGKRGGAVVTESLTPANANGNDTLAGTQVFDSISSIAIPTQGGTGGTFVVGVRDICAPVGGVFCGVELAAAGTLYVAYGEASTAPTDGIVIATAQVGVVKPIAPTKILTDAAKTTVGLTVYLP